MDKKAFLKMLKNADPDMLRQAVAMIYQSLEGENELDLESFVQVFDDCLNWPKE